jgi:pyruvate formate lyase activating enzyme
VVAELGPDVPMHFTAFHPDYKMLDVPPTPPSTLRLARDIARRNGVRYAYTGNVHDEAGGTTSCHCCHEPLIVRDWYVIRDYRVTDDGRCRACGAAVAGVFEGPVGRQGRRRAPVRLATYR